DPNIKNGPRSYEVTVVDLESRNVISSFRRESTTNGRVALSPGGDRVALVDWKVAAICETSSGREVCSLAGPLADVQLGPVFGPSARLLASFGGNALHLWDGETGRPIKIIRVAGAARALALSPDGRWLAASMYDAFRGPDVVSVWNVESGKVVATFD